MIARTSLRRLYAPGGGLPAAWAWWTAALASWLPPRWRALFGLARERLLLGRDTESLSLRLESAQALDDIAIREIGRLPLPAGDAFADDVLTPVLAPAIADLPRWLLLPASAGLRRRLSLPAAAAERLRDVVGFEIDRQTPFSADAVVFDARIIGRRADGQLDAELVAVPRVQFDTAVAGLGALAATLSGVDLADADGRPLGINLLASEARHRQTDRWRGWNLALAAVALIALAAGLWQVLANRRQAADAFEQRVSAASSEARQVAAQRQRLLDAVEGAAFLDRARSGRPTAVEVLDELSRRLPGSTYLEKLSIEGDQLLLIGLSSEAPALVGRLEGSPLWRSPALTGGLTPDPRTRRDRFTLTAQLAVKGEPANPSIDEKRRGRRRPD